MIGERNYSFIMVTATKRTKSNRLTLEQAIKRLLSTLVQMRCTDCLKTAEFTETANTLVDEPYNVVKRFVVTSLFPFTIYLIHKETAGDIDQELFVNTLSKIKNKYFKGEF